MVKVIMQLDDIVDQDYYIGQLEKNQDFLKKQFII